MRHGIAGNRLSRNRSLRKATLRDLAKATLIQQRICTTKAKAKEARKLVDHLITLAKKGTLEDKRRAFAILCDHGLVSKLFNKTAARFSKRVGGYTRIIPLATKRRGDNANLAFLELTEKEQIIVNPPKSKAAKKAKVLEATAQPVTGESADVESESKEVQHEHEVKKDSPKAQIKKPTAPQEKLKPARNFLGGLRKIFNRKAPGQ